MKKGDIWIATVIYIAIGIVVLTLVVAAGVPLINNMRDRNTFIQSKEVMHTIDDAISEVVSEGPGSRRSLNPIIIKRGELSIVTSDKIILWQMQTKAKVQEISSSAVNPITVNERNLNIIEYNDPLLVDYYVIQMKLDYKDKFDLTAEGEGSKLSGKFGLVISNEGITESSGVGALQKIKIKVI